jgi:hypothetical protein
MTMNYYFEFGGGLGDIFFRIFAEGEYRAIQRLLPEDRVRISLITINAFADELFEWHPKRHQLDVSIYPHWWSGEDEARRAQFGLPPKSEITRVSPSSEAVVFYTSPSDSEIISQLQDCPYFVLAASAGGGWRAFPDHIISMICNEAANLRLHVIGIGRNYPDQRGGLRHEPEIPRNDFTIDLVDQLSVPGSAKLIEQAAGVICSHSSVCNLAWRLNKPVLLLYPWQVYQEYCEEPSSGYFLGMERPTTRHALFDNCTPRLIREFLIMGVALNQIRMKSHSTA